MMIEDQIRLYMLHLDLRRNSFQHNPSQMLRVFHRHMDQEVVLTCHVIDISNLPEFEYVIREPEYSVRIVFAQPD